ncbi:GMC family oxidoreductase [Polynucleobacter paneuropaeus]|nr:GMC family oxidoreductase [Polynucleobacter paneuropaeus]QWD20108.1 GMC family oxidoreductase [Polynucleobacter paneuropaeus]
MLKPSLVIIGAGLGGCILADFASENFEVTLVELPDNRCLADQVQDIGYPANLNPFIGSGLGGSTKYWHNGLIEIDDQVFLTKWPFKKSELAAYYNQAFEKLSGNGSKKSLNVFNALRRMLNRECGIPSHLLGEGLFYSSKRNNAWKLCDLSNKVNLVRAEVIGFHVGANSAIQSLRLKDDVGTRELSGDVFVLSAGGIGTPILLQELGKVMNIPSLSNAGAYYEDHPTAFVADLSIKSNFYKFWNFKTKGIAGSFRIPISNHQNKLMVSFQLRPAYYLRARDHFVSSLSAIRNCPTNIFNYLKLITNWSDLLEIISFKVGINFPTKRFCLLMVAEQPANSEISIRRDIKSGRITRNWVMPEEYLKNLEMSIHGFFDLLGNQVRDYSIYPAWRDYLTSSAHHSGTARMHKNIKEGVCNENAQVHGIKNLYVCDGSLIPSSGSANTGLTIAALAIRLADWLRCKIDQDQI